MVDSHADLSGLVHQMNAELSRLKAQVDSQGIAIERLTSERDALAASLKEEQQAHQQTRRELAATTTRFNDLRHEHDALISSLANLKHRYESVLDKEYGPSSERLCVLAEMIPEVLDALADEGTLDAQHAHSDADSTTWVDPISQINDESIYVNDDAACEMDGFHRDADCIDSHDGIVLFAFDNDSDGNDVWTPITLSARVAPAAPSPPPDEQACGLRRPANAGGRNPLPDHLERRTSTYEPPENHPDLVNALKKELLGYRCLEKIDIPDLKPFVQAVECPIYKITLANGITYQQTISPPSIIHRGQVTDHFLVSSAVDKYADHLPGYRQEQRLERAGACVPRSKLCRWHISLATFLSAIAMAVRDEILAASIIGIDDSVHRQPLPGTGKCRQNRIWAFTIPKAVYYEITTTREAKWVEKMLAPYAGGLMGDACASHGIVLKRADIVALFCWAHVRRYFAEAEDIERRNVMLFMIAELYRIEERIKNHPPDEKVSERMQLAKPVLESIKMQLDRWKEDPQVLPTSGIGKAVTYALNQWHGLATYCHYGLAPIDNNHTEQCMRPNAMNRKNSLFNVSDEGTEAYAILLTLIQTAKLNGLDPAAYINDVIEDLHFKRREPSELTPMAYARRQKSAAEEELVAKAS